jgi:hypothetical protein
VRLPIQAQNSMADHDQSTMSEERGAPEGKRAISLDCPVTDALTAARPFPSFNRSRAEHRPSLRFEQAGGSDSAHTTAFVILQCTTFFSVRAAGVNPYVRDEEQ